MSKTPAATDPVGDVLTLARQVDKDAVALFGAADSKHLQNPYPTVFYERRAALVDSGRALEGSVEKLLAGWAEGGPSKAELRHALKCLQDDVSRLVEMVVAWKEKMNVHLTQASPEIFGTTVANAVRAVRCQRDQLAKTMGRLQEVALGNDATSPILTPADRSILKALAVHGGALKQHEIVREVASLCRRGDRAAGLVPVSQTVVEQRLPVLLGHGYIAPPLNAPGKSARRKGVGITEAGRGALKNAAHDG